LASLLIHGPEARYILSDLDDALERDAARGLSRARALGRYATNVAGSAASLIRASWTLPSHGVSWLDIKVGVRMLGKHPGLTAVAVFALAVGIPVGLVPFHAAAAFQAPPPLDGADRIQILKNINVMTSLWEAPSLYDFERLRAELTTFESLAASTRGALYNVASDDGAALPVHGAEVTASMFAITRVAPLLGRGLSTADEALGAPDVVVISHDLWQSRFGSDPDIVGKSIRIGGVSRAVVGVMPDGFLFPVRDHLWLPAHLRPSVDTHDGPPLIVFGRLADKVTPAEAETELVAASARLAQDFPELHARLEAAVVPYTIGLFGAGKDGLQGEAGFYAFQMLALMVLVVACANVGMLILARTATRSAELAVRTALGASRTRVVAQLFTEALVFAVLAAGIGLLVADRIAANRFDWMLDRLPYWIDFGVTPTTTLWGLVLAVFSAGLVSVVPALKVTGRAVGQNIQRAAAGRSGIRFGGISSVLIIVDVAVAVVAVALALGLSNGLTDQQIGTGIEGNEYLYAELRVPRVESSDGSVDFDATEFARRAGETQTALQQRLAAEPGVRGVAVGSVFPGMDHYSRRIEIEGQPLTGDTEPERAMAADVDIDFFAAFDHPILSGRGFHVGDINREVAPVVVNTGFVDWLLGGQSPIGRRVRYVSGRGEDPGPWLEIIGVVGPLGMDVISTDKPGIYHPLGPGDLNPARFAIHVDGDPTGFTTRLRDIADEVDSAAIISNPQPLDEVVSFNANIIGWVTSGAAALMAILLALSISGTYALMSFTIAERTREIGIRAALGAQRSSLVFTIGRRALAQLGIGVLLGMAVGGRLLHEVQAAGRIPAYSPLALTLVLGIGVTLLVGSTACVAPTLRALKILPTEALRRG
jgi:predicted permease